MGLFAPRPTEVGMHTQTNRLELRHTFLEGQRTCLPETLCIFKVLLCAFKNPESAGFSQIQSHTLLYIVPARP